MLNTHSALLLNFVNLLSVWPHFYIKIVSLNEQTWMVPPTLTMKADRWMCLSFYQESHLPWKSHAKVLEKRVRPTVKPIQKDNMVFFLVVEWSAFFFIFSANWGITRVCLSCLHVFCEFGKSLQPSAPKYLVWSAGVWPIRFLYI